MRIDGPSNAYANYNFNTTPNTQSSFPSTTASNIDPQVMQALQQVGMGQMQSMQQSTMQSMQPQQEEDEPEEGDEA